MKKKHFQLFLIAIILLHSCSPKISIEKYQRTVELGDSVEVSWKVKNASKVSFNKEKQLDKSGTIFFTPNQLGYNNNKIYAKNFMGQESRKTVGVRTYLPHIEEFNAPMFENSFTADVWHNDTIDIVWEVYNAKNVELAGYKMFSDKAIDTFRVVAKDTMTGFTLIAHGGFNHIPKYYKLNEKVWVRNDTLQDINVFEGQSGKIGWNISKLVSVEFQGETHKGQNGYVEVAPLETTIYDFKLTYEDGTVEQKQITVTVLDPLIVEFKASPVVLEGLSTLFEWTTRGADSVTISGIDEKLRVSGRKNLKVNKSSTYELTLFYNKGKTKKQSVSVRSIPRSTFLSNIKINNINFGKQFRSNSGISREIIVENRNEISVFITQIRFEGGSPKCFRLEYDKLERGKIITKKVEGKKGVTIPVSNKMPQKLRVYAMPNKASAGTHEAQIVFRTQGGEISSNLKFKSVSKPMELQNINCGFPKIEYDLTVIKEFELFENTSDETMTIESFSPQKTKFFNYEIEKKVISIGEKAYLRVTFLPDKNVGAKNEKLQISIKNYKQKITANISAEATMPKFVEVKVKKQPSSLAVACYDYSSNLIQAENKTDSHGYVTFKVPENRKIAIIQRSNYNIDVSDDIQLKNTSKTIGDIKYSSYTEGTRLDDEKIAFQKDEIALCVEAKKQLNEVYNILNKLPNATITVVGAYQYTQDAKFAKSRGITVKEELIKMGIDKRRVFLRPEQINKDKRRAKEKDNIVKIIIYKL